MAMAAVHGAAALSWGRYPVRSSGTSNGRRRAAARLKLDNLKPSTQLDNKDHSFKKRPN